MGFIIRQASGGHGTYFRKAAASNYANVRRTNRLALGFFGVSWLAGALLLLFTPVLMERVVIHQGLLFLLGYMPFLGAAFKSYAHTMALAEQAKQFERMGAFFRRGEKALGEAPSSEARGEILRTLGREALVENGDWILLHRERPLTVPT